MNNFSFPTHSYLLNMMKKMQSNSIKSSHQSGKKPCWNGLSCHYLKQKRCHFYHPPQHYEKYGLKPPMDSILQFENSKPTMIKKQFQAPPLFIEKNKIELLKVQTKLPNPKKWFFDKTWHFQYKPPCPKIDDCSICLEPHQKSKNVTRLYCKHYFHTQCIEQWLKASQKCPLCKANFMNHEQFKTIQGYKQLKAPSLLNQDLYMADFQISQYGQSDDSYQQDDYFFQDDYHQAFDDFDAYSDEQ